MTTRTLPCATPTCPWSTSGCRSLDQGSSDASKRRSSARSPLSVPTRRDSNPPPRPGAAFLAFRAKQQSEQQCAADGTRPLLTSALDAPFVQERLPRFRRDPSVLNEHSWIAEAGRPLVDVLLRAISPPGIR